MIDTELVTEMYSSMSGARIPVESSIIVQVQNGEYFQHKCNIFALSSKPLKSDGKYTYHLIQHLKYLRFAREVFVCFISSTYSRTPLVRINWDGETTGYAENPDNWIFL